MRRIRNYPKTLHKFVVPGYTDTTHSSFYSICRTKEKQQKNKAKIDIEKELKKQQTKNITHLNICNIIEWWLDKRQVETCTKTFEIPRSLQKKIHSDKLEFVIQFVVGVVRSAYQIPLIWFYGFFDLTKVLGLFSWEGGYE